MSEYILPHDPSLESAILGSVLLRNHAYDDCAAILNFADFYLSSNQTLFEVMGEMIREGSSVDVFTLANRLERLSLLSSIGGRAYLFSLTEGLPKKLAVREYSERVLEFSHLRQLAALGEELTRTASDITTKPLDAIGNARVRLEAIVCDAAAEKTKVSAYSNDVLQKWLADRRRPSETGLPYGITGLDERTGGMYAGENTTVGGDPGHGKSSLMLQAVQANCPAGNPVFLVSLEMTKAQILKRLWANVAEVDPSKLRRPKIASAAEEGFVMEAAAKVSEWPLHIYDKSSIRLEQLTGMLRLSIRRHKVKLFCVDFAQIISSSGKDFREQVSRATTELTAIAKGEGVHLMLLSQMSRKSHSEWNRPPRLSDLRESGALEQNAHCVVLIHRPWDEANGRIHAKAAAFNEPGCELIVAKQREGATSAFPVEFNEKTLSFEG